MKYVYRLGFLTMAVTFSAGLFSHSMAEAESTEDNESYYDEMYRPQFHFTPEENWMNDPNGLVYYEGEYHMFYQYNPEGATHDNMHWGHAVSEDLVNWEHLDTALEPDEFGTIFSGSAVVDENNTSGLFEDDSGGLVAMFTHDGDSQQQSIAYSEDNGRSWEKYEGNPVIENEDIEDFRDPKVFWHEDSEEWIMVLAAGDHIQFYSSPDLKDWEHMSDFGEGKFAQGGVWECPDLFEIPIDGDPENTKWVLSVDLVPGGVAGGSGAQYIVGDFDGEEFTTDQDSDDVKWVDYGPDFYASQSWDNTGDRTIWTAWMSNWDYAEETPTSPWRGAMAIPRELGLTETDEGEYVLTQDPIDELEEIRDEAHHFDEQTIESEEVEISDVDGKTQEIVAEFELGSADEFGFHVRKGDGELTKIGYDTKDEELFVDRTASGETDFHENFEGVYATPLETEDDKVKMHIFVDHSSVEVFGNDGEGVLTNQIFPDPESDELEIYAKDGNVNVKSLDIYDLESTWADEDPEDPGEPTIENLQPTDDISLNAGESVAIEFESEPNLDATFSIRMPLVNTQSAPTELPMTETEEGHYVGYWTATSNVEAEGAEIEVATMDEEGNETRETAEGRLDINVDEDSPDDITVDDITMLVEDFDDRGEFESDEAVRSLTTHLTALSHYEQQEDVEKFVNHLDGFQDLLDNKLDNGLVSEEAFEDLHAQTDTLIENWG